MKQSLFLFQLRLFEDVKSRKFEDDVQIAAGQDRLFFEQMSMTRHLIKLIGRLVTLVARGYNETAPFELNLIVIPQR